MPGGPVAGLVALELDAGNERAALAKVKDLGARKRGLVTDAEFRELVAKL